MKPHLSIVSTSAEPLSDEPPVLPDPQQHPTWATVEYAHQLIGALGGMLHVLPCDTADVSAALGQVQYELEKLSATLRENFE